MSLNKFYEKTSFNQLSYLSPCPDLLEVFLNISEKKFIITEYVDPSFAHSGTYPFLKH